MDAAVAADSRTAALLHRLANQRGPPAAKSPHGTPVVNAGPQSSDITHHPRVIAKAAPLGKQHGVGFRQSKEFYARHISRAHVDPIASTRDTGTSGSASNAPSGNRPTPFGQAQQSAATTVPSRPAQGGSGEHRRSGHHRASTAPSEQTSTSLQSLRGSSFQATAGSEGLEFLLSS